MTGPPAAANALSLASSSGLNGPLGPTTINRLRSAGISS